eukprot:gene35729-61358_t
MRVVAIGSRRIGDLVPKWKKVQKDPISPPDLDDASKEGILLAFPGALAKAAKAFRAGGRCTLICDVDLSDDDARVISDCLNMSVRAESGLQDSSRGRAFVYKGSSMRVKPVDEQPLQQPDSVDSAPAHPADGNHDTPPLAPAKA